MINDVGLVKDSNGDDKLGYKTLKNLASGLKKITFDGVQRNPKIAEYELRGKQVVSGLYDFYMNENYNKNLILLPAEFREPNKERTIIDYISGMTDEFAAHEYMKYYGKTSLITK